MEPIVQSSEEPKEEPRRWLSFSEPEQSHVHLGNPTEIRGFQLWGDVREVERSTMEPVTGTVTVEEALFFPDGVPCVLYRVNVADPSLRFTNL